MSSTYAFPTHRIRKLQDPTKTPLIFVACGSFSPLTFLHLRMFEMARDHAHTHGFEVVGGYLSPVNDQYKKRGLASSKHRVRMCELAVDDTSDWLMVDDWEARQSAYTPTARVLDHFQEEINVKFQGIEIETECDSVEGGSTPTASGPSATSPSSSQPARKPARIMLLAGSDLILTMTEPGVWDEKDLHHILGLYGCFIIERSESELDKSLFSSSSVHSRSPLVLYRHNIYLVEQLVRNDISSTKVRMFLRKGMSVQYLIPGVVVKYIQDNHLYCD